MAPSSLTDRPAQVSFPCGMPSVFSVFPMYLLDLRNCVYIRCIYVYIYIYVYIMYKTPHLDLHTYDDLNPNSCPPLVPLVHQYVTPSPAPVLLSLIVDTIACRCTETRVAMWASVRWGRAQAHKFGTLSSKVASEKEYPETSVRPD